MSLKEVIRVDFKHNNGSSVSLNLYSHFTCIYGKDSAEGKTHFVGFIERSVSNKLITVLVNNEERKFAVATDLSLDGLLLASEMLVILIDEVTLYNYESLSRINKSKHAFIVITRSMNMNFNCPLCGIYKFIKFCDDGNNVFDIVPVESLPLASSVVKLDSVVVESKESRSEGEFLSQYVKVIASSGKNRVEKLLRHSGNANILVFTNLGNISGQYSLLMKRCKDNPNIRFYDYLAFEQLLYDSSVVNGKYDKSQFDYVTIERFYEECLEDETKGTDYEYKHGKKLHNKLKNYTVVLDSKVGSLLREYIDSWTNGGSYVHNTER